MGSLLLEGQPGIAEDSPLKLTQGKSLVNILKRNIYNTTYLTQGKSLEILSKGPWSAWNMYILVSMYSTKPLATVTKPGNAMRLHTMNGNEISLMEKIAREGK